MVFLLSPLQAFCKWWQEDRTLLIIGRHWVLSWLLTFRKHWVAVRRYSCWCTLDKGTLISQLRDSYLLYLNRQPLSICFSPYETSSAFAIQKGLETFFSFLHSSSFSFVWIMCRIRKLCQYFWAPRSLGRLRMLRFRVGVFRGCLYHLVTKSVCCHVLTFPIFALT